MTGFRPDEISMIAEFTEIMETLWQEDINVMLDGSYWSLKDAYVSPKPVGRRPIMVSTASSEAGLAYTARYSHLIFITSPGDQTSWRGHNREQRIIGSNRHVLGTPERVVDQLVKLHAAGCDGVQINFSDFAPNLEFFGTHIITLLKDAGLRVD